MPRLKAILLIGAGLLVVGSPARAYDEDKFTLLAPILVGKECTLEADVEVVSRPDWLGEVAYTMHRNDRAKYESLRSAGRFWITRVAHKALVIETRWIRVTKELGVGGLRLRLLGFPNSGTEGWVTFRRCR